MLFFTNVKVCCRSQVSANQMEINQFLVCKKYGSQIDAGFTVKTPGKKIG
jgi:hypothetical protein